MLRTGSSCSFTQPVKMGLAKDQISSSGYKSRPKPSTCTNVFNSNISCGGILMWWRRAMSKICINTPAKSISLMGFNTMGATVRRMSRVNACLSVLGGIQPARLTMSTKLVKLLFITARSIRATIIWSSFDSSPIMAQSKPIYLG